LRGRETAKRHARGSLWLVAQPIFKRHGKFQNGLAGKEGSRAMSEDRGVGEDRNPSEPRPRTVEEELQAYRQHEEFSRKVLKLLHEFLVIEGLDAQWETFAFARATGVPYTPLCGRKLASSTKRD
jgi:hypothetical protein